MNEWLHIRHFKYCLTHRKTSVSFNCVIVWIWNVPKRPMCWRPGHQPVLPLGGSGTLGGKALWEEVSHRGSALEGAMGTLVSSYLSLPPGCHKVSRPPLSPHTLTMTYWATTGPEQQEQFTLDRNLWNNKPKQTFLPFILVISGVLSQWQKVD